jgi:hypothetical protein
MINTPEGFDARTSQIKQLFSAGMPTKPAAK